jgi:hypothetical protein
LKTSILFLLILSFASRMNAQSANCTFKPPHITINFGSGNIPDANMSMPVSYERVGSYCPTDGHYAYISSTSDCFHGDWHRLDEDHTAGDVSGNMMLVNSAYTTGVFLKTYVTGLKGGATYEFGVWMINVCRITDKCPYPLLPNITLMLVTPAGKVLAKYGTGEVERHTGPSWMQHKILFTMPASLTSLILVMMNNKPGGCGNDFAIDDLTFRECVKTKSKVTAATKSTDATKPTAEAKKSPAPVKPATKKPAPVAAKKTTAPTAKAVTGSPVNVPKPAKPTLRLPLPPKVLTTRENALVKQIETVTGDILVNLYDNGEIDDDTVSIYHNNVLLKSRIRLSDKPITFTIAIDSTHPHHELVMVAENLGSIPPNTSLMIVTAGAKRYEVFISASEQKNAKVIFDLKE